MTDPPTSEPTHPRREPDDGSPGATVVEVGDRVEVRHADGSVDAPSGPYRCQVLSASPPSA